MRFKERGNGYGWLGLGEVVQILEGRGGERGGGWLPKDSVTRPSYRSFVNTVEHQIYHCESCSASGGPALVTKDSWNLLCNSADVQQVHVGLRRGTTLEW